MAVDVHVSNELIREIGRDELERQLGLAGKVIGHRPSDGYDEAFCTIYSLDIPDAPATAKTALLIYEHHRDAAGTRSVRVQSIDFTGPAGQPVGTITP